MANALRLIRRTVWVGFWFNAALMILKIVVGYGWHSDALVADGFHSLSDFVTDVAVLLLAGLAYRCADDEHPYGYGKYETVASLGIAVVLGVVGIGIAYAGITSIIAATRGVELPRPGMPALIVAFVSIGSKEWLFRYTVAIGKRIDSSSLIANAWHHRSDAISSIATVAGVGAAMFLGDKWRILDPVASCLIAVFIIISAIKLARPSFLELLEVSVDNDVLASIERAVSSTEGVKKFHHLRTRRNGHTYVVDLHIKVDPDITVTQGHDIATAVEQAIRAAIGNDTICSVHVEPYTPKAQYKTT